MSLRKAAQDALAWMERADWMTFGAFFKDGHKIQEAIRAALAEADNADDKALRFDLDRAGIEQREREAVELVELRAALTDLKAWKDAVHDALVINWTFSAEHEDNPRKAVADLIAAEVRIALDPLASSEAQALIDRGRAESAGAEACAYPDCKCPIDKTTICAMGKAEAPKAESAGAEPVAWVPVHPRNGPLWAMTTESPSEERLPRYRLMKLFAHPPAREAELSDEEIQRIWDDADEAPTFSQTLVAFARAVLAAARGKG